MKNEQAYAFAARIILPFILLGFGVLFVLARRHQRRPLLALLIFIFGLFPFFEYWRSQEHAGLNGVLLVFSYGMFLLSAAVAAVAWRREKIGRRWCGVVLLLDCGALAMPCLVSPTALQSILGG